MHRRANGGESELLEGSAAACLETGVPTNAMAMLVRAGLPSRIAAQAVIEQLLPIITTRGELIQWLRSPEVEALSGQLDWPTAETSAIWRRFRSEALAGAVGKWVSQEWNMPLRPDADIRQSHPARIAIDPHSGQVSITTPDHRPIVDIQQRRDQRLPSLFQVQFSADGSNAHITRMGSDTAGWVAPQ